MEEKDPKYFLWETIPFWNKCQSELEGAERTQRNRNHLQKFDVHTEMKINGEEPIGPTHEIVEKWIEKIPNALFVKVVFYELYFVSLIFNAEKNPHPEVLKSRKPSKKTVSQKLSEEAKKVKIFGERFEDCMEVALKLDESSNHSSPRMKGSLRSLVPNYSEISNYLIELGSFYEQFHKDNAQKVYTEIRDCCYALLWYVAEKSEFQKKELLYDIEKIMYLGSGDSIENQGNLGRYVSEAFRKYKASIDAHWRTFIS